MNKILLIIKREYLTRVRKKSFIIMTILGPILLASLMIIPFWLATRPQEAKIIDVKDESNLFADKIKSYKNLTFNFITASKEDAKIDYLQSDRYGLLYIPALDIDDPKGIEFYSRQNPGIEVQSYIQRILKEEIESRKLQKAGIDRETLENIKTKITINTIKLSEEGEKDSSAVASTIVGYFASFMIYFFIFLYGVQIMRGVIEEKTSRIVEIIISSVKPFQLMMGKIIGIALVGLTQLLLWVILTFGITSVIFSFQQADNFKNEQAQTTINEPEKTGQASEMFKIVKAIQSINIPLILSTFVFFFIGGYLLYGALFAAVGSAVDNETDTQQFMLPITIPLIIAIVMAQLVLKDPGSSVVFWMSIIPFTSPIIMMMRIPFGVPAFDLILSMTLLIAGFIATTWFAAKIYRVGILMYGKKVNYKEISKWLFYK